jgi:hypothetical protein
MVITMERNNGDFDSGACDSCSEAAEEDDTAAAAAAAAAAVGDDEEGDDDEEDIDEVLMGY